MTSRLTRLTRTTRSRLIRCRWLLALSAAGALSVAGCAARKQADAVADSQRQALNLLAEAHAADLAALRVLTEALLGVERRALEARLARAVAARYITADGGADLAQLEQDIDAPAEGGADSAWLADAARQGAMTREQAREIASSLAAALRAPADERTLALSAALAPAPQLAAQRDESQALLEALDARSGGVARLLAEVGADADALDALRSDADPDAGRTLRTLAGELWRQAVLERLDDPQKRAAAQRVLDRLLGSAADAGAVAG